MTTTAEAIALPFVEAIGYFARKSNATSRHWTDVWQAANAHAFTVAGATTEALVEDFRAEIRKALEEGTTLADFRQSFDEIVSRRGWRHTGAPGWRARVIYETNLSTAYSAGRYHQQTQEDTLAAFPYWEYVHSGSQNPREQHLDWNGLVLRADDPFWQTHYPPNGWRCGCWVRVVSARGLGERGLSGPMESPTIDTYFWTNPRTGEAHEVPVGIDPSFDYNPGREWAGRAPEIPEDARLTPPAL